MLISLREYCEQNNKDGGTARRHAAAGRFATAQKIGRDWVIDDAEPWPADNRIKSGNYKNWRKKETE